MKFALIGVAPHTTPSPDLVGPELWEHHVSIYDVSANNLDGTPVDLHDFEGRAVLVVNVASKCGLTPQYGALEELHERFSSQGFSVLGVPSNQFMGQEPGTAEEIASFCSTTYGVTFPILEKADVNGDDRHELYQALVDVPDAGGYSGDIRWNFEKFLLAPDGTVAARFEPTTVPDADEVIAAIEANLPG